MTLLPKYSDTIQAIIGMGILAFLMLGIPSLLMGPQQTLMFWNEYRLYAVILIVGTSIIAIAVGSPRPD